MGSGPRRARQSRSLPSLIPLSLKRLLIRPSDERSPISERKFPLANNRRRRLLAFFTRPRSTNGGRSLKRRESTRSEEMSALGQKQTLQSVRPMSALGQKQTVIGLSVDPLLDSVFTIGSPLTSRTSIGPPGVLSSKTPIASRPVYHAQVSRLVRFFLKIGPCAC